MSIALNNKHFKKIYERQKRMHVFMRWFFIVVIMSALTLFIGLAVIGFSSKDKVEKTTLESSYYKLGVDNFEFTLKNKNNIIVLHAKKAVQNRYNLDSFFLEQIKVTIESLHSPSKSFIMLFEKLHYDKEKQRLYTHHPFVIQKDDTIDIIGKKGEIMLDNTQISVIDGELHYDNIKVQADKLDINQDSFIFQGHAKAVLQDNVSDEIYFTSDRIDYYDKDKKFFLIGNSSIETEKWTLQSHNITSHIILEGDDFQLAKFYAVNEAKLQNDQGVFMADFLFFDKNEQKVYLKGNGKLKTRKISLESDEARYDLTTKKIIVSQKRKNKPVRGKIKDLFQ